METGAGKENSTNVESVERKISALYDWQIRCGPAGTVYDIGGIGPDCH